MQEENGENGILLPHHVQQTLCTTRLPYRQGRKLTAVKVYSISKESNHLLIFGVPSLNLRQETKALFIKFGKLIQFNISKEHTSEPFTDTYHAQYERIQSARHAKKMLDSKNFYGGILHVCYAPELENVVETRQKLFQRQRDVEYRLRNLGNDLKSESVSESKDICKSNDLMSEKIDNEVLLPVNIVDEPVKLNMGVPNTIYNVKQVESNRKRKLNNKNTLLGSKIKKKDNNNLEYNVTISNSDVMYGNINITDGNIRNITSGNHKDIEIIGGIDMCNTDGNITTGDHKDIEVIDCTEVENEVITNINDTLNYNNFGSEIIRTVPEKPVNKIQFHFNKKS